MKSLAVEIPAPGCVRVVEDEIGEPGPGDVLIHTLYSGISAGTESLIYRGEMTTGVKLDDTLPSLDRELSYPVRYGYSCVGVAEGSSAEGDHLVFAFHPHQDRFWCPADQLVPVEGIPPRLATLFPLVETALQASLDAGRVANEAVVVVGLGAVGTLTAALLTRAGGHVIGVDPRAWRRSAAGRFGVDGVDPAEASEVVEARTEGRGTPLVIEASGNPRALATCLGLLAHEGTALVVSWYGNKQAKLPLGLDFHRRRLVIRSSQVSSIPAHLSGRWTVRRRRSAALQLMTQLPLDVLATHEWPLSRAAEAFEAVASGTEGLIHAALRYD